MTRISVLLAEDHIVVREGIRELIQREEDMEVVGEASDGQEAVEMVHRLKPDVVLMDISMPGLNGIEATREIKTSWPSVGVLVLTAHDNEEFVLAVLEAKAAGYLLKNVHGEELVSAIRSVYQGESVLHPEIAEKVIARLQRKSKHNARKTDLFLSKRELQVVELGATGLVNKEIADRLSLSERTVQSHWRNMFSKLGVGSRIEVVLYCLRKEWIALSQDEEGTDEW